MSKTAISFVGRRWVMMGLFVIACAGLVVRAVYIQLENKDFLQSYGNSLSDREEIIPANRGMISDRNGEPLAISTPLSRIVADPLVLMQYQKQWAELAEILEIDFDQFSEKIKQRSTKRYALLKRSVTPDVAEKIKNINGLKGIDIQSEYRRFYPAAEVTSHVVGFTEKGGVGLEGLERIYGGRTNEHSPPSASLLKGIDGSKKVIKDQKGRTIKNVEQIKAMQPGQNLVLSIDKRIQYLAYRELAYAIQKHKARTGSIVVLDSQTGEILAMVNQPSYNPNNRKSFTPDNYRNRAAADAFEPGSTMKPLTIAAALEAGVIKPDTTIDTRPGRYKISGHPITDHDNYGVIDITTLIKKSSNVGASKVSLKMEPETVWDLYKKVGFGVVTNSGLGREASGSLRDYTSWSRLEQATMSFGYGLSVSALQLAQAYTVIANDGKLVRPTIFKLEEAAETENVLSAKVARQVRAMMETVVEDGTAKRAQIPGYRIAGKTGTVHIAISGGYAEDRYTSLFVGIVPASNPRLVTVVVINESTQEGYYGGLVAAPAFSKLMSSTLRILNISPDASSALRNKPSNLVAGRQP